MVDMYNTTSGTEDSTWYAWNTTKTATDFPPSRSSLMEMVYTDLFLERDSNHAKKPRVPYWEPFRLAAPPPERVKPMRPRAKEIRPEMLARSRCG